MTQPTAAALDYLDASGADMLTRTEAWSRVNSGSLETAGLQKMAGLLADAFATLGDVERVPLQPSERVRADGVIETRQHGDAVRVRVRSDSPVRVALTGHYDTVFAANHPFQTPERVGARVLRGPGCADMKGGLNVMLRALQALELTPDAKNVGYEILLSPDEEIGSPASAPLLAQLGARAHVGMTYEPALPDGSLAGARKGSGNYSLILEGRAAHVGRAFDDGRSAIVAAADAVMRLNDLNGKRDGVTVNIGAVDGGAPVNMVPAGAVVRFNVRVPDAAARQWIEGEVAKVAACACARDGITARLHGGVTRAPKPMTQAQETLFGGRPRERQPQRFPRPAHPAEQGFLRLCHRLRRAGRGKRWGCRSRGLPPAACAKATTCLRPAARTWTRSVSAAATCTAIRSTP